MSHILSLIHPALGLVTVFLWGVLVGLKISERQTRRLLKEKEQNDDRQDAEAAARYRVEIHEKAEARRSARYAALMGEGKGEER